MFSGLIDLQKAVCDNVDGALLVTDGAAAGKAAEAAKAAQKKAAVKPKPETVIEMSPDTEEVKQEKPMNSKKTGQRSSRKKEKTMTSILTSTSTVIFRTIVVLLANNSCLFCSKIHLCCRCLVV